MGRGLVGHCTCGHPLNPPIVEQRAPPMFGRATIRLGIDPHSSYHLIYVSLYESTLIRAMYFLERRRVHVILKLSNIIKL